jgi:Rhs element Vgr protein
MVRCRATDWDFIVTRAELNGFVVIADDGEVKVHAPALAASALTLTYGATLMELEAEQHAGKQLDTVASAALDHGNQEMLEESGTDPGASGPGNLTPGDLSAVLAQPISLRHAGALASQELKSWADARLLRSRFAQVIGRARCQGIATIKPGATITLAGVGDRFNGDVYVAGVHHDISLRNWETSVQLGLSDAWLSERGELSDVPAAGLVPAVPGLQIGLVTQLESDPDGADRIQVVMPAIDPQQDGIWARVATLDAGDQRGAFFRPEIGDEVVLGFLDGDPRHPIVLGQLHSSNKPAPLPASDDNHEKAFVTRSGMRVHFNDDTIVMTLDTPAGNSICLSEDDGAIKIVDQNQNSFVFDAEGIALESAKDFKVKASGDITLEGTNVTIKASAQLKAEGTSGAEVSSGGNAVLKGTLVQIN